MWCSLNGPHRFSISYFLHLWFSSFVGYFFICVFFFICSRNINVVSRKSTLILVTSRDGSSSSPFIMDDEKYSLNECFSNSRNRSAMCHVSCVMCHVSCVMCHVSCVMCPVSCVIGNYVDEPKTILLDLGVE